MHLKSKKSTRRNSGGCCCGIFGRKYERLEDYEKKLEDMEGNMREVQSSVAGKVKINNCSHWFKIESLMSGSSTLRKFFWRDSKLIFVFYFKYEIDLREGLS